MDNANRQQLGDAAENKAYTFLLKQGLQLIERNYNCYFGEIDLIMQDQEDIVFVEVRSRQHTKYGTAAESVNHQKRNKLIKTATHFLQRKKWLHKKNSRFDVIAIRWVAGRMQLEWIKNAFTLDKYW